MSLLGRLWLNSNCIIIITVSYRVTKTNFEKTFVQIISLEPLEAFIIVKYEMFRVLEIEIR